MVAECEDYFDRWIEEGRRLHEQYDQWSAQILARINGSDEPDLINGALQAEFFQWWAEWVDWCDGAPGYVHKGVEEAFVRRQEQGSGS